MDGCPIIINAMSSALFSFRYFLFFPLPILRRSLINIGLMAGYNKHPFISQTWDRNKTFFYLQLLFRF